MIFDLDPLNTALLDLALLAVGRPTNEESRAVLSACAQAGFNVDPRIPPMKLARLGSACGGTLMGLATAFAALQSSYVGMSAIAEAAKFLVECRSSLEEEYDDQHIDAMLLERRRTRATMAGFGVPGRPSDERVVWLSSALEGLSRGPRPWWHLFEKIGARLSPLRRRPNLGGGIAAAMLDLGCDPRQVGALACVLGVIPLVGNALEGATQAPEILRRLPPSPSVRYTGPGARISPRAAAHEAGG